MMRDREVEDELRFHLDMRVRDYLALGYTPAEAERLARERFGDVEHVRQALASHDKRRERMSRLWQDARLALRGFRRSPTFTLTAVLILGIGIGVAAAMWSVCSAVLMRPLPVTDQDRIIIPRALDAAGVDVSTTPPEALELKRSLRTIRDMATFAHYGAAVFPFKYGDRITNLRQAKVSGNFFAVLGARPLLGRLLRPEEDSTSHVVVLSYGAWQRYFGGDPTIIGRGLTDPFLGTRMTIVGVAPPGLDYPVGVDCWTSQFYESIDVIARLAPTASPAAARSEFLAAELDIDRRRPTPYNMIVTANVKTLREAIVGDARQTVIVVTAAVALLLLIACVNVGNLFLLRATARSRELAVRRALGATATDLAHQLVIESIVLAALSGVVGLAVAEIAQRVLVATAPRQIPNLDAVRASGLPIGPVAALAVFAVLLFGVVPALAVVHRNPTSPLRLGARSGGVTRQRRRLRQLLVASQVALALIMLTGAGLLARSLVRLQTLDLGYRTDHLILLDVISSMKSVDTQADILKIYDKIAPHLRAVPGVTAMTPVVLPPFFGPEVFTGPWEAEGQTDAEMNATPNIPIESGGPEYFRTLGIPILHGRGFVDGDRENAPQVAIVSQSVARMFWPDRDPVGKRIRFRHDTVWRTVVGVAGDIHYRVLREVTPTVFLPFRQYFWQGGFVLRSALTPAALLPSIRRAVTDGDPTSSLWELRTMDDILAGPLAEPRLSAIMLSMFGFVALGLAAIGLYGIMASAVREQARDIGVRMALGATPTQVQTEVLRRAMIVSLAGAAVGLLLALAASRVIASLLFQVSPTDPIALTSACGILLAVALIAAYLPARYASRVDPARALQAE